MIRRLFRTLDPTPPRSAAAILTAFIFLSLTAAATSPVCISTNAAGQAGDGDSGTINTEWETVEAAAFVVAGKAYFVSFAANFGTTPAADGVTAQLFSKDLSTGQILLLSLPDNPAEAGSDTGDDNTLAVSTSADGTAYAALSEADNFMAPTFDSNPGPDVFLWFPGENGPEVLCASGPAGQPFANGDAIGAPSLNLDGTLVVFASRATVLTDSDANGAIADIFLFDQTTSDYSLLSISSNGIQGNADSLAPSISTDGQFVVFASDASNLVADDSNGVRDIFLRDRSSRTTVRVNHTRTGGPTTWPADSPRISPNGRFVVYVSGDPDIVSGDNNGVSDVFVWDRTTDAAERVSVDSTGTGADAPCSRPWMSEDGRFVVFLSAASNLDPALRTRSGIRQVFLRDRDTGRTQLVSVNDSGTPADADCFAPFISNDGRYITFSSKATVFGDPDGTHCQVFLIDRGEHSGNHPPTADPLAVTATPGTQIEITLSGSDPDGDPVSFQFLQLPARGVLSLPDGSPVTLATMISDREMPLTYSAPADWTGDDAFSFVALDPYAGRSDAAEGVVRVSNFDRPVLSLVSVAADGQVPGDADTPSYPFPARIGVSTDFTIAFGSRAANLVTGDTNGLKDVFLREYWIQRTTRASTAASGILPGNTDCFAPAISPDGGTVVFVSAGDSPFSLDLFLFDKSAGTLDRVALDDPQSEDAPWAALAQHGDVLVFSTESALAADDTDNLADVYRSLPGLREFQRISTASGGGDPDGPSLRPAIDWTGDTIAFVSRAGNLVPNDTNGHTDVFVYRADSDTLVRASPAGTNADSASPSLSMGGRFLAFESAATNIVQTPSAGGFSQIYVADLVNGTIEMVSTTTGGAAANADCTSPTISADGRYVCFLSAAPNLASPELATGTPPQAWVKDRGTGEVLLCSQSGSGDPANGPVTDCAISPDGRIAAFATTASNLLAAADGGHSQLVAADLGPRPNSLPTAAAANMPTDEDTPIAAIPLVGADADGDDLVFEIVTPPTRGDLGNILPIRADRPTATVSYTPAKDQYGVDTFTFRCRDANGWSEPATITVQIAEVNDPPILEAVADQEVNENQTLSVPLVFVDADAENQPPTDTWTFRVTSGPGEVVAGRDGFAFRYTPDYAVATPANPDVQQSVTVAVDDGRGGTAVRTFSVVVHDVNAPPQAAAAMIQPAAPVYTTADLVPEYQYSDIDGDTEDGTSVAWFFRDPGGGTDLFQAYTGPLVSAGGSSFSVPASATTKHQQWYFTVTPRDARGAVGGTIESPHIEIANSAPTLAVSATLATDEDTPATLSVTVTDADPAEPLTLQITQPVHGTVAESARGVRNDTQRLVQLRYTPSRDFFTSAESPELFTLTANDGEANSSTRTVNVTVNPVNDAPVLSILSDIVLPPGGETATVALAPEPGASLQISDVDNTASEVGVRLSGAPANGVLTDNTGATVQVDDIVYPDRFPLTYAANPDAADVDEIRLTAFDGDKTSQEAMVRIFLGFITTTLTLSPGWNLVAVPMQPSPSVPADLFADPAGRTPLFTGQVWRWDAAQGIYRVATSIEPGQGYWLYCPSTVPPLELRGMRASSTEVETGKGWYLVGPVGYGQTGVVTALGTSQRQASPVMWRWNADLQKFVAVQAGNVQRNSGYWLLSRTPTTFDLDLPWSETVP